LVDRPFWILYRVVLARMERDPIFLDTYPRGLFEKRRMATLHVVPPGSPIAGDRDGKR
jgi:hypothetical protein